METLWCTNYCWLVAKPALMETLWCTYCYMSTKYTSQWLVTQPTLMETLHDVLTAGSDRPPQQSAKQTSGSGLSIANARLPSLDLNFEPGDSRFCSHYRYAPTIFTPHQYHTLKFALRLLFMSQCMNQITNLGRAVRTATQHIVLNSVCIYWMTTNFIGCLHHTKI